VLQFTDSFPYLGHLGAKEKLIAFMKGSSLLKRGMEFGMKMFNYQNFEL
jgi:hypothetical protein